VDKDILRLISELEEVTRVRRDIYLHNSPLLHYFQGCVRPNGASMPQVLITKQMLDAHDYDNSYMLRKKIGKLKDTQVYWLCHEMACARRIGFETVLTKSLYVLLNQSLKEEKKRKKNPPRNIYWW
jgi:hypothetical protein